MQEELVYRHIPLASLFAALGVIFPIFFHLIGLGSTFLPMFLPIIMGSLLLPLAFAISIAIIVPIVSFVFTGMPPIFPPILPVIVVELVIVAFIASFMFYKMRKSIWITLLTALALDRLALFLFVFLLAPLFNLPKKIFSFAAVVHGAPGIILILITIPLAINFLRNRYPELLLRKDD